MFKVFGAAGTFASEASADDVPDEVRYSPPAGEIIELRTSCLAREQPPPRRGPRIPEVLVEGTSRKRKGTAFRPQLPEQGDRSCSTLPDDA